MFDDDTAMVEMLKQSGDRSGPISVEISGPKCLFISFFSPWFYCVYSQCAIVLPDVESFIHWGDLFITCGRGVRVLEGAPIYAPFHMRMQAFPGLPFAMFWFWNCYFVPLAAMCYSVGRSGKALLPLYSKRRHKASRRRISCFLEESIYSFTYALWVKRRGTNFYFFEFQKNNRCTIAQAQAQGIELFQTLKFPPNPSN